MGRPAALSVLPAVPALALAAHIGPAATWLPAVRRAVSPALSGLGDRDHVALTFDDGPDPDSTPYFLDTLDRLCVRATFFMLGEAVRQHPELTREIARRGHELAVHGWSHGRPWLPTPVRDVRELSRAQHVVRQVAETEPRWYRPPYGILTGGRWSAAHHCGLRPVLWSAWGRDWKADATAQSVLTTVRRDLRGGGTILLHDTDRTAAPGTWRVTLAMLPELIDHCRTEALRVGPLAEHGIPTVR
ncbi:polysaccharide deacetylase family protein [Streptomyces sp. TS71-3]|uniref:polysaccharide deacetylase family protein n=1 Tax=Streptomyces sp. TS71-3 TaxID=2733862 RepID=UPI001B2776C2|nr:polysaccharide deacetylase family protein [Streptomyces sp. TS71-3]GHJ42544.1 polysaccharide deacetylase familiy protein [Streptomyces sp. TS71-3]